MRTFLDMDVSLVVESLQLAVQDDPLFHVLSVCISVIYSKDLMVMRQFHMILEPLIK